MTIKEISDLRKTQDNSWHMTSDPIYLVQKKERDYGLDSDYSDNYQWFYTDDYDEVQDEVLLKELEEADDNYEADEKFPNCAKVYYRDRWEFVTLFFTEKGARDYIERNKHRATEMRVYVDSAYRNEELKEVIKFLESVE